MQPLTEVVKINAEQMICQSLVDVYEGNPDKTLFKDDDFDFSEGSDFDLHNTNESLCDVHRLFCVLNCKVLRHK